MLTPTQTKILSVLDATGGAEPGDLAERVGLSSIELEREIAALRHMEKVRGELRGGKKYIRLW
jgi:DNA-binding transcriptional ArsR family regulator